ncbi:exodeoxyribonuclease 7 large subunit XseA [Thermoclostridium stercorarium subsp. stercorarium DSM 8532]|uniref:Exodeoxyribonuclease 7 large subunit n=1 Tax=Thermoclostridium stercorarium (strain ATCC 35414 / DSM 8532 / NCIMB 11754) TaxID=1121335 RepID=L7VS77_THES1|nr:exodeoxyribonuclease VII large subunit [Thermoclostridium stercorarium]AGC69211.1 exodeoxyribonuclease 7 large subunit XseA [Thermoclostridium stercorarium subsp. stercorarium DSM 8532]AGI40181.1 exodeoxyribonuclease-7 large subunit [Thermoclostridium stercorarium subsp. stercorarium DSM 8532]
MQEVITVTQLTRYIKRLFAYDSILSDVCVMGEISNFKLHSSGHMYFTLKDESSVIRCVMFRSQNQMLKFKPKDGMKVIVRGYVSIYEAGGSYQLYPEYMEPAGLGNLYLAFEQLKQKLEKEGLFRPEIKKKIPYLPRSIAVVTSPTGAVIRDIINILFRRFPNAVLKLFPVQVQGEDAARQIAYALDFINRHKAADVIILARGGGSLEELWPFNEEIVAWSIYRSEIPVISAVGHETDFSISDFVADLRAPTPSAAAELVIPEKEMLVKNVMDLRLRLKKAITNRIQCERLKLEQLMKSPSMRHPLDRVNQKKMDLEIIRKNIADAMKRRIEKEKGMLSVLCGKLDVLSPLTVLARGYSITMKNGNIIKSAEQVHNGDKLDIILADGKIKCVAEKMEI